MATRAIHSQFSIVGGVIHTNPTYRSMFFLYFSQKTIRKVLIVIESILLLAFGIEGENLFGLFFLERNLTKVMDK